MSAGVNGTYVPPEDFYASAANDAGSATDEKTVKNGTTEKPGIAFLDHDDLFTEDPPNENLVVPELGIGAGPPIGLFGQGYVGKTLMAMSLGMAVGLGVPAWGRFTTKQGVWVHFDYEQGKRHTKGRVQKIALGFGVTKEELRGKLRVAVYPSVNLTTADALKHYTEAMQGAAIATVDALKGITPGVDENSSTMRDYMHVLSMASDATGCAVVLIHHTGKLGESKGRGKPRKEMGRGSSGIYDECQAVFVATGEKDEDKRITHDKDRELGHTVEDFFIRIAGSESPPTDPCEDISLAEPVSGLRITVAEHTAGTATARERNEKLSDEMIEIIRANPGKGTAALRALAKEKDIGGKDIADAIVEDLVTSEIVEDRGNANAHRYYLTEEKK